MLCGEAVPRLSVAVHPVGSPQGVPGGAEEVEHGPFVRGINQTVERRTNHRACRLCTKITTFVSVTVSIETCCATHEYECYKRVFF